MAGVTQFVGAVDAFLAADKQLIGADAPPEWQPGGNADTMLLKLPIEVGGELRGARLEIAGYPRERVLKYRISIIFPPTICRIDYVADEVHPNTLAETLDDVPHIVRGPHFHPWQANRRFFRGSNTAIRLHNAVPFVGPRTFDAGLRWLCGETRITLPANHQIELPRRTLLI